MKIEMQTKHGTLLVTPAEYLIFLRLQVIEAKVDGVVNGVYNTYSALATSKETANKITDAKDKWLENLQRIYDETLKEVMEIANDKDRET